MKPFARIVLSPVLAVLTGSCRVMFRMAVIVGLLCNGCATIPEHPSTSIGKCAQDMRIFDIRLADKVVDATSYEEVEGILGLPSYEFGSGIVYNQWVFICLIQLGILSKKKIYQEIGRASCRERV